MNHADYILKLLHERYNSNIIFDSTIVIGTDLEELAKSIGQKPPENWTENLQIFISRLNDARAYVPVKNKPSFLRDPISFNGYAQMETGLIVPEWLANESGQNSFSLKHKTYYNMQNW